MVGRFGFRRGRLVAAFSAASGVIAVSGIFGGLTAPSGQRRFGVRRRRGAPGVIGVVVAGVRRGRRARLRHRRGHHARLWRAFAQRRVSGGGSAQHEHAARGKDRAPERQPGAPRLPGAPAPHCRHQSWPWLQRRGALHAAALDRWRRRRRGRRTALGRGSQPVPFGGVCPLLGSGRRIDERRGHRPEF